MLYKSRLHYAIKSSNHLIGWAAKDSAEKLPFLLKPAPYGLFYSIWHLTVATFFIFSYSELKPTEDGMYINA